MSEPLLTRRLRVRGRVQGVGFRDAMRREATALAVSGWVRNRLDGSVEAVVHGAPPAVEALVRWAHRGPPASLVLHVEEADDDGRFRGFDVRPTA